MKHLFIINPAAGKGKSIKYLEEIKELFKDSKEEYHIELTKGEGHATEIVKEYTSKENYRVYSIGGDGTLNEVLNGMVFTGSSLGVIPAGTGNDFIRNIYSRENFDSILKDTINGQEESIDLAKVNKRYFINISSAGLDAEVVNNARKLKKNRFINGGLAYLLGIFITIFKFKSLEVSIEIDEEKLERKTLLVAVANGRFYGGGMLVAPEAQLQDGVFDICIVKHLSIFKILRLFPRLIKGTHKGIKEVEFKRGKKITIYGNEEFCINIDGELSKSNKVEFQIIPKAVKIIIPN